MQIFEKLLLISLLGPIINFYPDSRKIEPPPQHLADHPPPRNPACITAVENILIFNNTSTSAYLVMGIVLQTANVLQPTGLD